ncbi:MAG: DUF3105 domain-containing protein [Acidimicrobiales bacterium]|nr:DUF3105 domain-containing protein [Acidimicrobiales bacterium]
MRRGALVVLALLAGACGSSDAEPATTAADSNGLGAVQEFEIDGAEHVDGTVDYPQSPPVGGDHRNGWQNCGFYDIEVPNEQAVHSLEHGAVWVTYSDEAPAAELEQLRERAAEESHLLVTRYTDQDSPFVLTAWARQLDVASTSDPAFESFLATFMETGPTTPEPGATCSSAFGIPPDDPSTIAQ